MFDIGGIDSGADDFCGTGKAIGAIPADNTARDQQIALTPGMQQGGPVAARRRDLDRRLAGLPSDRKAGQIRPGEPVCIAYDKCHRLSAEPRRSLGQRRGRQRAE